MAFWMGVASAQHACGGRDGGFALLGHGKQMAVKVSQEGDWIVYYSAREGIGEGEMVQAFMIGVLPILGMDLDTPAGFETIL